MQNRHLFEYAIIRVVPRVEREEFINVGVILYCAKQNFLKCVFEVNLTRLAAFECDVEAEVIQSNLSAITKICYGGKEVGAIGELDLASRFRWLTATRSTVVQTSKVHPGFCNNADETLNELFHKMVS